MRVLVVDDNEDVRFLLVRLLQTEGHVVSEAGGGTAALELLNDGARALPEIVVLDVQMPDLDGWDTLHAIRARAETAALPVILCTVKGQAEDTVRGWELGCDGYVTKPFDIDLLLQEVSAVAMRDAQEREKVRAAGLAEARRALEETRRSSSHSE